MQGVCNVYLVFVQRDQTGYAYRFDCGRQKFLMHWKSLSRKDCITTSPFSHSFVSVCPETL